MTWPADFGSHGAPQTPQKRCFTRHCIMPRACATTGASRAPSALPTLRRSANGATVVGQQGQRVVDMADVDREDRLAIQHAKESPGAARHVQGLGGASGDVDGLRLALLHAAHQVAGAPDRHIQRVGMAQRGFDPRRVVAPLMRAVERIAGVDVRAGGNDQGHGKSPPGWE